MQTYEQAWTMIESKQHKETMQTYFGKKNNPND